LPPEQEILSIEAIVVPVIERLAQAALLLSLNGGASSNLDSFHNVQLPNEIRVVITSQLQTLSGATKGLTRAQDLLLIVDELSEYRAEAERLPRARDNYRMVKVREDLFTIVSHTATLWSMLVSQMYVYIVTHHATKLMWKTGIE